MSLRTVVLAAALVLGSVVSAGVPARAAWQDPLMPPSTPQWLVIPKIGVHASVEAVNLYDPASSHAPYKWGDVAWFDSGPRPGAIGHSLIFGHVDSTCCPAVFYYLHNLKAGDDIYVQFLHNYVGHFRVQWLHDYANNDLPLKWMYGLAPHDRGLILVTCTGDFHRNGVGYDHKYVVYAQLVAPNTT